MRDGVGFAEPAGRLEELDELARPSTVLGISTVPSVSCSWTVAHRKRSRVMSMTTPPPSSMKLPQVPDTRLGIFWTSCQAALSRWCTVSQYCWNWSSERELGCCQAEGRTSEDPST